MNDFKGLFLFVFDDEMHDFCFEQFQNWTDLCFDGNQENLSYLKQFVFPCYDRNGNLIKNFYSFPIAFVKLPSASPSQIRKFH